MDEGAARALVGEGGHATGGPRKAKRSELLRALESTDSPSARSILLRGLGVQERWEEGAIAGSVRLLELAVDEARRAGRPDLVAEALLSLSGTRYFGGDVDEALALLDRAEVDAADELIPRIEFQRASIAAMQGWYDTALAAYARLLDRFQASGDDVFFANTLSNRGLVLLDRGDPDGARRDLERARAMFMRRGDEYQVASTDHSLGRVAARSGDVLRALRCFHDSEQAYRRMGKVPVDVQVNRCEVLLEAGLYSEAESIAIETERALLDTGNNFDRSHALYLRSVALLGQSRLEEAARAAERSAALFHDLHRDVWEQRAKVVQLLGGPATTSEVEQLALKLETAGQWLAAAHAWMAIADRDPSAARAGLQRLPIPLERAPFEFRLADLSVRAHELAQAGDVVGALEQTRAAIALADRQRGLLGALDLRAAVSAQLRTIAELGLQIRRRRGHPWAVLRWADRCRAASFRMPAAPVAPDHQTGDLLTELRALQLRMRTADPIDMPVLLRRQARLQRDLVAAQRLATPRSAQRAAGIPRRLPDRLRDVTVVHHHNVGDHIGAVVVRGGRASLVELGGRAEVSAHRTHLMRKLRSLASGIDDAIDAVERHATALSRLLLPDADDSPCVVVPTADLLALPWALLPTASPRPVTVAPNLAHWLRPVPHGDRPHSVGLVAGVDLTHAGSEVDAVAAVWHPRPLVQARRAAVQQALDVIGSSDIVHVACHGERAAGDGRFAQLRLSDGSLTGFEIAQLPRLPRLMVFAACDAGLMEPLPGDEASGLSGLLFAAGVDTVIAPVGLLPDNDATTRCMVELHRHLAAGATPSVALHAAQMAAPAGRERTLACTVSCYGRG